MDADLPVVELRRYLLVPGRRDEMIAIFERELVESQEAAGIRLLGFFRDLDEPEQFVWFRGFPDMESRRAALTDFYSGPVWKEHAPAVRRTMVDTDDVLLLRPARPGTGFHPPPIRPAVPVLVATSPVRDPAAAARTVPNDAVDAWFVTEPAPNTYPALPVRAGESVVVTVTRSDRPVLPTVSLTGPAHVARLVPTTRSPWPG